MALEIYTDGGNSAKNEVGGCAAIVVSDSVILAELAEAYQGNQVTNNTMELSAVILGLTHVLEHPELGKDVVIVSDSEYVVNGASKWLRVWKLKNWKTTTGLVKNKPLWEAIDYLTTALDVEFRWTKGHSTNTLNNLADKKAVAAYTKLIK